MLNRIVVTVMSLLLASLAGAYNPGFVASIDTILVENHKEWLANFIIKSLNKVQIPDIVVNETSVQAVIANNTYELGNTTWDEVTVLYSPEDNAIRFRIDNLMAKFLSSNFSITVDGVETSGIVYADIYKFQAYVGVTPSNMTANVSGRLIPDLEAWGVELFIDKNHVLIDCEDSIIANYINLFAKLFIGKICDGIEVAVAGVLYKQIPTVLNKRFIKHQGIRHWTANKGSNLYPLEIDFSIPYNWRVTEERIMIYYNGETYVPGRRIDLPEQMPALPEWNVTMGETYPIQAFAGDLLINSLCASIIELYPNFGFNINSTVLNNPFDMVTLNFVLPGLLEHYGFVNKEMNIFCQLRSIQTQKYLQSKRQIMAHGELVCDLYVVG